MTGIGMQGMILTQQRGGNQTSAIESLRANYIKADLAGGTNCSQALQ
jgi:hypothetical protein